jgi:hypothetical protein
LAKAASWARENNDTLVDVHWIGGSPMELQVYGWAAWSPNKGILALRNPNAEKQIWYFEPASVLELPPGAATMYRVNSPNGKTLPFDTLVAGISYHIELQPFEVIVMELQGLSDMANQ